VPYKAAPATLALLAGEYRHVCGIRNGHIKRANCAGSRRGEKRSATFPDLPTLSEFFPGSRFRWIGIFTAAGVRAGALSLHGEINRLLSGATCAKSAQRRRARAFISTPRNSPRSSARSTQVGEVVKASRQDRLAVSPSPRIRARRNAPRVLLGNRDVLGSARGFQSADFPPTYSPRSCFRSRAAIFDLAATNLI